MQSLVNFLKDKPSDFEQVGFILRSSEIVQVKNICVDSKNGFAVSGDDLLKYDGEIVASWHTHPGTSSNLSIGDYDSFKNWPQWRHYIVGQDDISEYYVDNGDLLAAD